MRETIRKFIETMAYLFANGIGGVSAQYNRMIEQAIYDAIRSFEAPRPKRRSRPRPDDVVYDVNPVAAAQSGFGTYLQIDDGKQAYLQRAAQIQRDAQQSMLNQSESLYRLQVGAQQQLRVQADAQQQSLNMQRQAALGGLGSARR